MKPNIQYNYQTIRNLIKNNVDTIITLVEQAQSLEKIVSSISDSGTENELKQRLEKQISNLRSTIAQLVSQTEDLFTSYDEMVESTLK